MSREFWIGAAIGAIVAVLIGHVARADEVPWWHNWGHVPCCSLPESHTGAPSGPDISENQGQEEPIREPKDRLENMQRDSRNGELGDDD